jgi:hypothetical protein
VSKRNDAEAERLADLLQKARAERDAMKVRLANAINQRLAEHTFHSDGADTVFQVGWSSPTIRFWCDQCRTPWPCRTYHDLKAVYGETTQWGGDLQEYAPLELRQAHRPEPVKGGAGEASDG